MSPDQNYAPFDGTTPVAAYDTTTVTTGDPTPAPADSTPATPAPADSATVEDGLQAFEAELIATLREAMAKAEQQIHDTIATGVAKIAALRDKVKSDFDDAKQALDKV